MSGLHDPAAVQAEYASEAGLAARAFVYFAPRRVVDVGCGRGQLAERIVHELGADVVGVDQSERMVTNGREHMRELYEALGAERPGASFSAEDGAALLRRHCRSVERRHARGSVLFPDRAAAQAYVDAMISLGGGGRRLPPLEGSLRATRAPVVFVVET